MLVYRCSTIFYPRWGAVLGGEPEDELVLGGRRRDPWSPGWGLGLSLDRGRGLHGMSCEVCAVATAIIIQLISILIRLFFSSLCISCWLAGTEGTTNMQWVFQPLLQYPDSGLLLHARPHVCFCGLIHIHAIWKKLSEPAVAPSAEFFTHAAIVAHAIEKNIEKSRLLQPSARVWEAVDC